MERKSIDYASVVPEALDAMLGLERVVRASGLEPALLELVKLRASQINGCARCVEMHAKDARARRRPGSLGSRCGLGGSAVLHQPGTRGTSMV